MRKLAFALVLIIVGFVTRKVINQNSSSQIEIIKATKKVDSLVRKQKKNNRHNNATSQSLVSKNRMKIEKKQFSFETIIKQFSLKDSLYNIEEADVLDDLTVKEKSQLASYIFKNLSSDIIKKYDEEIIKQRLNKIDLIRELINDGEVNSMLDQEIDHFLSIESESKTLKVDQSELLGLLCRIEISRCIDRYRESLKVDDENTNKIFITRELLNMGVSLDEINSLLN